MKALQGEHVYLRALEPTDLELLYELENNESIWEVSHTQTPYSKYVLKQYLDNAHRDIFEVKQLRLVVCPVGWEEGVGLIDFFDFDPKHRRVGVGIVIFSDSDRQRGYATESLELLCNYARKHLQVHQVYANITEDNTPSIRLFEKLGFEKAGTKVDWILSGGVYKNELLYQKVYEEKS
ncbi:GNAT family N-acetyltransferase [Aureisphaera galaxeae]|uniref:GNAT family N-acetyltransferase n=1 Tax=Aureisphaera galaxeae TaxID=1538023 RepID=UPI00235018A5|nr:GNAT family N-acetyltransferase [Aureisphaera galaxeae]MDC8004991.1 GNAT family N-acetyltransferase [Aureisphaera galaxeae]